MRRSPGARLTSASSILRAPMIHPVIMPARKQHCSTASNHVRGPSLQQAAPQRGSAQQLSGPGQHSQQKRLCPPGHRRSAGGKAWFSSWCLQEPCVLQMPGSCRRSAPCITHRRQQQLKLAAALAARWRCGSHSRLWGCCNAKAGHCNWPLRCTPREGPADHSQWGACRWA